MAFRIPEVDDTGHVLHGDGTQLPSAAELAEKYVPAELTDDDEFSIRFEDGEPFVRANENRGIHDTKIDHLPGSVQPEATTFTRALSDDQGWAFAIVTTDNEVIEGWRTDGTHYPPLVENVPGVITVNHPDVVAVQEALDEMESRGGGVVKLNPKVDYRAWTHTLRMPSYVELDGQGASIGGAWATSLALIINKGSDQAAYGGAHDYAVRRLAIDSPGTNGIAAVHAKNVLYEDIIGKNVDQHFFDNAGVRNLRGNNLRLTGHSGAAPFQFDSAEVGSNNNRYRGPGGTTVEILRDDTGVSGASVSGLIVDTTTDSYNGSVHHHRGVNHSDIVISDSILRKRIIQDADTSYPATQYVNCVITGGLVINGTGEHPKYYDCLIDGIRRNDS